MNVSISQGSTDSCIFCLLFGRYRRCFPVDADEVCAVGIEGYCDNLSGENGRSGILILGYADAHDVALDLAVKIDLTAGFNTLDRVHAEHVGHT